VEIEVPVERIVEVPQYQDITNRVDVIKERFVENRVNTQVDKLVELKTTYDKPVINKQIHENKIQKFVDRKVEVPVEKYVEIPVMTEKGKMIDVLTTQDKAVNIKKTNVKQLKKSVRRSNLSKTQKQTYTSLGDTLNRYKIDNIKLSLEIKSLEQQMEEYTRISQNPEQLKRENTSMRQ
jgi:hypothetical protein